MRKTAKLVCLAIFLDVKNIHTVLNLSDVYCIFALTLIFLLFSIAFIYYSPYSCM